METLAGSVKTIPPSLGNPPDRRRIMKKWLLFLLVLWPGFSWALTAEEIAWKVYHRPVGKDSSAMAQMILINAKGQRRIRKMKILTREDQKARYTFIRFLSPADIAGTGFLAIAYHDGREEQFLYLPALKRTRRVAGSFRFHRFVNSDFFYEDLERHHPEKYHHELLGEEKYLGSPCFKLRSSPKKKKESAYGYWIQWITTDGFLPVRIDYYDRKSRLWKRFEALKWQKLQGYWTILRSRMIDFKKNHRTELVLQEIVYDQGLDPKIFTRRSLERW
jgi:hypothetical protein